MCANVCAHRVVPGRVAKLVVDAAKDVGVAELLLGRILGRRGDREATVLVLELGWEDAAALVRAIVERITLEGSTQLDGSLLARRLLEVVVREGNAHGSEGLGLGNRPREEDEGSLPPSKLRPVLSQNRISQMK